MKKIIVLVGLCLASISAQSQVVKIDLNDGKPVDERVSPVVSEKVETYAIQVREVVIREKLAMSKEVAKVDEDLKNGVIDASAAENLKAEIALRFSDKINSGIENLKFNLDEITKQQVQYTILNTDLEELKKEQEPKKKQYAAINQVTGFLSYGMILLADDDNQKLNDHLGYSSGIDFGLIYHKQLNRTSPFTFQSGLYLSWRTLRFEDDYFMLRNENGEVDLVKYDKDLDKSKLRATYLMVPIGFKYHFSKLKTDENGETYRRINNGFGIGLNLYGGVKISQNNIVKGDGINWRHRKKDMDLNQFSYGAQLNVEINNWNLFVRQDLSSYFKDDVFDDRRMLQFGINFGF